MESGSRVNATDREIPPLSGRGSVASETVVDILLVEDSEADAALALHILRTRGTGGAVQVLRDGRQALDYIFCSGAFAERNIEDRPKLILLDLNLPQVNGIEVLQRIKADPRTAIVPVVMLTSSQSPADMAQCYRLGANGYLIKEMDFEAFSETLHQAVVYWTKYNRIV